ncbi:MAG: dihydroorotase [Clostridia bacterium]|nr:dihydroorotase [Clostridia bacterium]
MKRSYAKSLLIKNCILVDGEIDRGLSDILILDGTIAEVAPAGHISTVPTVEVFDAEGNYAAPAFIDLHTHLRDPGFTYKEDIETGTAAAAAGGYGTVVPMPNTSPVTDNIETVKYVLDTAREKGSTRVLPVAAITKGLKSEELTDMCALRAHGAIAFSDDGRPVTEYSLMESAMRISAANDMLIISHSEELSHTGKGVINEGDTATELGVPGIPNSSEDEAVRREIEIAEKTGAHLHIAHVSTVGAVQMIREAKAKGLTVTGETCPHYFVFCDEDIKTIGTNGKMKPPLRSATDREAIVQAVIDGTLDAISTDHAPHAPEEKADLITGAFGITGLQSVFSASYTTFVASGLMTLPELVNRMSTTPAKILGLDDGRGFIDCGALGDIVIFSDEEYTLTEEDIKSKSKNTPFIGMKLKGKIIATFVGGERTY